MLSTKIITIPDESDNVSSPLKSRKNVFSPILPEKIYPESADFAVFRRIRIKKPSAKTDGLIFPGLLKLLKFDGRAGVGQLLLDVLCNLLG